MSYKLNLDLSPRKFTRGGVDLYLNWCDRRDGECTEPAYVFARANDRRFLAVMKLSELHGYVESTGFPIALAIVSVAAELAGHLGFARADRFAAKTVADLILDYAEDLVKMPPEPPADTKLVRPNQLAELEIKIDGKTVFEAEVPA
jgi:hypothetical protein